MYGAVDGWDTGSDSSQQPRSGINILGGFIYTQQASNRSGVDFYLQNSQEAEGGGRTSFEIVEEAEQYSEPEMSDSDGPAINDSIAWSGHL